MATEALYGIGGGIFLVLGTLHLVFTFVGNRFDPRDATVRAAMEGTSPVLTGRTSLWKAWVGFNASHSIGAMVFGGIYILLAWRHPGVMETDAIVAGLPGVVGVAYLALAVKYWFRTPLAGIAVATACFILGWALVATA